MTLTEPQTFFTVYSEFFFFADKTSAQRNPNAKLT